MRLIICTEVRVAATRATPRRSKAQADENHERDVDNTSLHSFSSLSQASDLVEGKASPAAVLPSSSPIRKQQPDHDPKTPRSVNERGLTSKSADHLEKSFQDSFESEHVSPSANKSNLDQSFNSDKSDEGSDLFIQSPDKVDEDEFLSSSDDEDDEENQNDKNKQQAPINAVNQSSLPLPPSPAKKEGDSKKETPESTADGAPAAVAPPILTGSLLSRPSRRNNNNRSGLP